MLFIPRMENFKIKKVKREKCVCGHFAEMTNSLFRTSHEVTHIARRLNFITAEKL